MAAEKIHHLRPDNDHRGPHIVELVNEAISLLVPYSALILTIALVVFFLVRYYLFEAFLLRKCYGDAYTRLSEVKRRGFVNHNIAGLAKIIMFVVGFYPFIDVTFGTAHPHSPYAGSRVVTMGDVLLVVNQLFVAMYIFELIFRAQLSGVAVAHHIGAIIIAQSAVAISLNWEHESDATIEFILCFVWGAFDIIAEFWPHVAIILYRVYPTNHAFLARIFRSAYIVTLASTFVETMTVMWLFGSLWHRWTLPFRVVTPILHVLFSTAQLVGAKTFREMWQRQKRLQRLLEDWEMGLEPRAGGAETEK